MRILHVYKTFINDSMGGTEQVIAQLSAHADNALHNHSVLSLSQQSSGVMVGLAQIKNIRFKEQLMIASNSMSWDLLRDFPKIVQDYDVIHYHFPWPFADLLHVMWRIKKPSIVTYHADVTRQTVLLAFYRPLMARFLRAVDKIVATSPQYLASSPILQNYRDKTIVIPIGIDRAYYPEPSAERLAYWRERFSGRFFLFVGVMRYYKGLDVLLEAMVGCDYPLLIVGSGPLEHSLRHQAQRLQLHHVYFLGHLSEEDKIALLQLCFAFVFPSTLRSEAFGVSLLEAAMLGKPLISTELGTGSSHINQHNSTGLVVPPNDVASLRSALNQLWADPNSAQEMGEKAAIRHQTLFTRQHMRTGYEALYAEFGPSVGV